MSDHDRGAYTPQNEAPLSFDARRSRGRRAFPTTLIISLVILAGLKPLARKARLALHA